MGLETVTTNLTTSRFLDSTTYRFPAFKGPHFDWTPDINHYGTSAIGLQEQLIQTWYNNSIRLLPAWPDRWNVSFKLYAPQQTLVEGNVINGNMTQLFVQPAHRMADVVYRHEGIPEDVPAVLLNTGTFPVS